MKAKILVGAIAALIYGNAALAQDQSDTGSQNQQNPDAIGGSGQVDDQGNSLIIIEGETEPVAPPPDVSSGEAPPYQAPPDVTMVPAQPDQGLQQGFGGSGQVGQGAPQARPGMPMQGQGGVMLYCTPVQQQATGGSGEFQGNVHGKDFDEGQQHEPRGDEQSSLQRDYDVEVGEVPVHGDEEAFGGAGFEAKDEDESKADMRGLTVMVGAGVEGYTGGLAPEVNPGAALGVTAAIRPSKVLGIELAYSGAVNNLDMDVGGSGPDIVRNGGQAALTFGLAATPVQPYVLGGFGISRYNIRNGEELGFSDDTNTNVPVGVGLRTHIGEFTADARVNYNFLFGEDFAPAAVEDEAFTGRYTGTINLGGTF